MRDPLTPSSGQGIDYHEDAEWDRMHAAIRRENREPRAGVEALSVWIVALYALTIFGGAFYIGRYSGNFSGDSLDPGSAAQLARKSSTAGAAGQLTAELTPVQRGKKVFLANCATCHQAGGTGVSGQYPPLAGSEYVTGGTRRLGMIVLKGLQGPLTVKGAQYGTAVMQPWDKTLTDAKIADVLTYIRSDWGNNASAVKPEEVAALRKELAGRSDSLTEAELQAIPAEANLSGTAADKSDAAGVVQVALRGMKYVPTKIEIRAGQTVEWKNDDITPHTVTSAAFDSGSIDPDKSWRRTFTEAGEFPYACTFHPEMKASVIVK
ncbi:MAG TPA: c-type cytochrome [Chthoniobacterales bacterium]|nr:c-type cytochrome [Chthoniobacterales bacterium]